MRHPNTISVMKELVLKQSHFNQQGLPSIHDYVSSITKKYDAIMVKAGLSVSQGAGRVEPSKTRISLKSSNKCKICALKVPCSVTFFFVKIASHLAAHYLNDAGLLVLTGAALPYK